MTKKKVVEIKSWLTDKVLATGEEGETLADVVARTVANRGDLSYARLDGARLVRARLDGARLVRARLDGARLVGASLVGASLVGARLVGARLDGASLDGASLVGASLDGASLVRARLVRARLDGASLDGASLVRARLDGASLVGASLPSPTAVLLAYWSGLSPQLVADLMRFDSENHPDPTAFDRWAAGGGCPYDNVLVGRAAHFQECRELWGKGVPCRPYDLMARALAEVCPDWSAEQIAAFEAKLKR